MAREQDIQRIVARVVEEVRRRLAAGGASEGATGREATHSADLPGANSQQASRTLVVLFTGGHVGLDDGIAQALALAKAGWRLDVVLSPRAEALFGRQRFAALGGTGRILGSDDVKSTLTLLEGAEAVVVPVLTRNTATKAALLIADSLATNLLLQAVAMGKPVLAARDAADPSAALCACVGTAAAPVAISRMMEAYFRTLGELGLEMVPVSELARTVTNRLGGNLPSAGRGRPAALNRRQEGAKRQRRTIVTADDVAAADPSQPLILPEDAIVTDVARETARRRGIEIRKR